MKLHHLGRLDERIAAHLDGLAVAGKYGTHLCDAALETPAVGEMFAAAVRALEDKDTRRLDRLFALAGAMPEIQPGLRSAFGWVSAAHLQGIVASLLAAPDAGKRALGLAACSMHGADPGAALAQALVDPEPSLRGRALRVAAELGRRDLLAECLNHLQDEDATVRFWAAWSGVLLGDRTRAAEGLASCATRPHACRQRALRLLLKVLDPGSGQSLLKTFARDPTNQRLLIQGAGWSGDPQYLPWLLKQMADAQFARLAGEAFSLITGLDLAALDLEQKPPEASAAGPSENPDDDAVGMDPDDSLPWPDQTKLQQWWASQGQRWQPGMRHFMGAPPSPAHCLAVLKTGYQRQRLAAAEYRCLLTPGTALFNVRAPAWRQERWLGRMRETAGS